MSDLTAVRRAAEEKRRLERKLAIAQRMETVGRLAGGVAHDFNNLLTVVLASAELIEVDPDANDVHREYAQQICTAGECAASLTRQLLAFGGRHASSPQALDLNSAIRTMEKMLRRLITENIELVVSLDPDLGRIEAAPGHVEQVILNLAVNARDAMPNGGRLTIETSNILADTEVAERGALTQPGQYVMMKVSDNGLGMDEHTLARAFDPFFTTKAPNKGTGLGLATVHDIVERGAARFGSTARPVRGRPSPCVGPCSLVPRPQSLTRWCRARQVNGEKESCSWRTTEWCANVTRRVLTRAGYQVIEAANGEEALRAAEKLDGALDLLLTDLVLPSLPGHELADRLYERFHSLRVLFTSGYSDDLPPPRTAGRPNTFLPKPFAIGELVGAVRVALGESSGLRSWQRRTDGKPPPDSR